ncbi:MAG: RICIN domain-containing protein, partial [Nitrospirales bacterium]
AVHSGKCIDVSLGTSSSSGTVHQWTCHGRPNQQWTWATGTSLPPEPPAPPSGQTTSFTVAHSSKCLEISDSSQSHGGVAIQNTCDSGENQQFQLTPVGSNTFQLIAQHSDQCLEIAGASTSNGARVQQNACHNGSNQRFRVTNSPSTLVAVHSGKCIDVSLGTSSSSGTIHQWTCHGRPNQQWTWAAGTSP